MICHIGMFKIADRTRIQEAADALWRLKDIVPGTLNYKVCMGTTHTPTTADICLIGKFDTQEHFNEYMNHPVHTDEVAPLLAEVCDYEIIERMVSIDFEM